jgi:hypothetical protein
MLAAAALLAHTAALAGFGLDSLIEILASTVVVWQLTDTAGEHDCTAMRVIGRAFSRSPSLSPLRSRCS